MKSTDEMIERARNVMRALQEWVENRDDLSTVPNVTLEMTCDSMSLTLAGVVLWNDHDDMPSELTFACCRDVFLEGIEMFQPFLQVDRTGSRR